MVTFLNILSTPMLGLSPANADSIALGEIARQQLLVFRTAVDCVPAAPEMIRLEQAIVEKDPKAGRFIPPLASRLADLGRRHVSDREVAMGKIEKIFKGGPGNAQEIAKEIAKLGEPLDVGIKLTDNKVPIRFRSATSDVTIEEKLFFVRGGLVLFSLIGPNGPNDPTGRELVRFSPPHVEEGVLLYIGKQKHQEPIQITSEPPAGVPLGLQLSLKGINGVGPHLVVGFRGDGRPKVDRADGLPNVGEGDVKLTLGDRLHIGEGYQLRLEPMEAAALRPADRVKLGENGETFIFNYLMPEEPRRTTSTPPAVSPQPAPAFAPSPRREMTPVPLPTMPTTWLWLETAVAPDNSNPLIFSSWLEKWWKQLLRRLNF